MLLDRFVWWQISTHCKQVIFLSNMSTCKINMLIYNVVMSTCKLDVEKFQLVAITVHFICIYFQERGHKFFKNIFCLWMFISVVEFITQLSFNFLIFKNPRLVYSHAGKKSCVEDERDRCKTFVFFIHLTFNSN